MYIYESNESPVDVFFDNLQVIHERGSILEETHYYPFGLTMAGISSKALNTVTINPFKFNGGTELTTEFDLYLYETFFRGYDPQIGRFLQADPLQETTSSWGAYTFVQNNPLLYLDPFGLDTLINGQIHQWDGGYMNEVVVYKSGYGRKGYWWEYETPGYGQLGSLSPGAGAAAEQRVRDGFTEVERIKVKEEGANSGGGLPGWMGDANTGMGALGLANGAKTEIIDYAIRSNYKSARTYSEFKKLPQRKQVWRTNNTIGKTGASYLKGAKLLGKGVFAFTVVNSSLNAGSAFYNDDPNKWGVAGKAGLDVTMGYIGFLGPIGFGISVTYFILDASGAFNSWSQPTNR